MYAMPPGIISYCQQTQLANGITYLRLLDNSLQAADELLDFLDRHIAALEPHQAHPPVKLLIELSPIGIPPLAYLSRCYQDLLKLHATKQFHARIAYLYGSNVLLTIVAAIFRVIRNAKYVERRFFRLHERVQAEAWLLEGQSSES
jgi:hypothetical protein